MTLDVQDRHSVLLVKTKIRDKEGRQRRVCMPPEKQRLSYGGKLLEENATLRDCGIQRNSTLFSWIRLRGGSGGEFNSGNRGKEEWHECEETLSLESLEQDRAYLGKEYLSTPREARTRADVEVGFQVAGPKQDCRKALSWQVAARRPGLAGSLLWLCSLATLMDLAELVMGR